MDDRYGANLPGAAAVEGGLPRVWSGGCGGVTTDALPDSERRRPGATPQPHPPPVGPNLPGLIPYMYAPWRGAWEGIRIGPTYRFTLRTATRGTQ